MRQLIFSLTLLIGAYSFSHGILPDKSRLRMSYQIVKDELKSDVPANKVRVKGTVKSSESVEGGIVSTLDRERLGKVDKEGNYEFYLRPTDTSIFFYKPQLDEIVIWSYKFLAGHEVEIDFYPESNMMMMEVDKPVIYLYSDEEVTLSIRPEFKGQLDFAYPELKKGWHVQTSSSGELRDLTSGKKYPYLFWEGQSSSLDFSDTDGERRGFLIKTDTALQFLESSLSQLSLNDREQADFITFWAPKLIQKEYAFIEFLVDEQYETKISKNTISAKPETSRRVFMLFTGFDNQSEFGFSYNEQSFSPVERKGLVLIEWGGSEIPFSKLNSL